MVENGNFACGFYATWDFFRPSFSSKCNIYDDTIKIDTNDTNDTSETIHDTIDIFFSFRSLATRRSVRRIDVESKVQSLTY